MLKKPDWMQRKQNFFKGPALITAGIAQRRLRCHLIVKPARGNWTPVSPVRAGTAACVGFAIHRLDERATGG